MGFIIAWFFMFIIACVLLSWAQARFDEGNTFGFGTIVLVAFLLTTGLPLVFFM